MPDTKEGSVQFKLILPIAMHDQIKAEAAINQRSMSAEITARLATASSPTLHDWLASTAPVRPRAYVSHPFPEVPETVSVSEYGTPTYNEQDQDKYALDALNWHVHQEVSWRLAYADAMLAAREGGAA